MKQKINESVMSDFVRVDVVRLVQDYPFLEDELNNIADSLHHTYGFEVCQEDDEDGNILMVIEDIDNVDTVIEILNDECDIDNAEEYLVSDEYVNESLNEDYEDYFDEYSYMDDEDDSLDGFDLPDDYEDMHFDDIMEASDEEFEDDEMLNDEESFEDEIFTEDEEFIDECDDLEECDGEDCFEDEDAEFLECLQESVNKKKGCCPPVKGKKLVNLSESLKKIRRKEITKHMVVNESIYRNAVKKLKDSNKANKYNAIKESLGAQKYNDIINSLKEGKASLYTKKTINGKNIQEYTAKELYGLLNEVKEQLKSLTKKYKSLNESASNDEKKSLKEMIDKKNRLVTILDEELTYRLTVKKYLNEDENEDTASKEEAKTDEINTDASSEEESKDETETEESSEETESSEKEEDPEKDEEVELSRVIITVANQAAADDLKAELVSAGVPEDAIEFETEDEEGEEVEDTEETDATEDTEETSEESTETEEKESEDTNESFHMNSFRRLLEADGDEETEEPAEGTEDAPAEGEDTEESDDKPVKVILTDTDHVNTLAQVLADVYGIEKEEFEEMIGGEIVDDEESDESDDKSDDEESEEEQSSNGDAAVDNMTDDDLAALFGESATSK